MKEALYIEFRKKFSSKEIEESMKFLKKTNQRVNIFTDFVTYRFGNNYQELESQYHKKFCDMLDINDKDYEIKLNLTVPNDLSWRAYRDDKKNKKNKKTISGLLLTITQSPEIYIIGKLCKSNPEKGLKDIESKLKEKGFNAEIKEDREYKGENENKLYKIVRGRSKTDKNKPISEYDERKSQAMRDFGWGNEPDWDTYDRACEEEDLANGIDRYAGI